MVVRKQASVKSIKRRSRKAQKAITGRAKEFLYRGHTLEELQGMELDELLPLLPARARRSYSREMNHEQRSYLKICSVISRI